MTYLFGGRISKIEERFEKVYKSESVATAMVESQMEFETVSKGWYVSLEGWGIAIPVGKIEPSDLAAGDPVILELRKR